MMGSYVYKGMLQLTPQGIMNLRLIKLRTKNNTIQALQTKVRRMLGTTQG